jgi:hypothetical protein
MLNYYQQAKLARLHYEARLTEADEARRFAHLRPQPTFPLSALLSAWLGTLEKQRWAWFAPQRPRTNDGVTAVRQQAC